MKPKAPFQTVFIFLSENYLMSNLDDLPEPLKPIVLLFLAAFLSIIFIIILNTLVNLYIGQLSVAAQGVVVVIFGATIYFLRDYIQKLIDHFMGKGKEL